ncbi:hypothetical protein PINS_up001124 [Pythium insidiosum]|nr:hypothetical protein PINS_up001124 [Pythium insidiosum]
MVIVSSSDEATAEAVEVIAASPGVLEIRPTTKFERKHLLVEVSLPVAHTLTTLDCIGRGTVIVDDNVLVADAPETDVSIRLTGNGDCFVTSSTDISVNSLSLNLTGSGDLQFVAPSVTARRAITSTLTASGDLNAFIGKLVAPDVSVSTTGSGDLHLASSEINATHRFQAAVRGSGEVHTTGDVLRANRLAVSVTGSGDITIAAKDEIRAEQVDGSVAGSGDVKLASSNAHCDDATLQVSGSGDLDLRDLVASSATAKVVGSGDVVVRAAKHATSSVHGSGGVNLIGPAPANVARQGAAHRREAVARGGAAASTHHTEACASPRGGVRAHDRFRWGDQRPQLLRLEARRECAVERQQGRSCGHPHRRRRQGQCQVIRLRCTLTRQLAR